MREISELVVTVKSTEQTYKQKFLLDNVYSISFEDPTIRQCVDEACANAKIEPEDITVRILKVIQ